MSFGSRNTHDAANFKPCDALGLKMMARLVHHQFCFGDACLMQRLVLLIFRFHKIFKWLDMFSKVSRSNMGRMSMARWLP